VKAKDVLKYGNLHQLAGVLPLTLTDGPEKGVRGALIRSGSGLNLLVLADRGMDIGLAEFEEKNLNWNSNTGFLHPSYFEPEGNGWLRGFYGGFLTTGGLTYMGAPSIDRERNWASTGGARTSQRDVFATHLAGKEKITS